MLETALSSDVRLTWVAWPRRIALEELEEASEGDQGT